MVSLYSTWWVKPGEAAALKPALKQLAKKVKKEEGTLMYLVHFPRYDFPKPTKKCKNKIKSEPMVRPGTLIFVKLIAMRIFL